MATFDDYTPDSNPDLINPERGIYSAATPNFGVADEPTEDDPTDKRNYHTIVPQWLWLAPWCDKPLVWDDPTNPQDTTSEVLKDYAGKLEDARSGGYKILFRPRYDKEMGNGPSDCTMNGEPVFHANSLALQKDHIDAVTAMLGHYKDVIAFIQAGYLGKWGEWNWDPPNYTPDNAPLLADIAFRAEIIDHVLFAYAAEGIAQDVELRRPVFAKEVVERWEDPANSAIYQGASPNVGFHNDCFMSTVEEATGFKYDYGTYENFDADEDNAANFASPDEAYHWAAETLTPTASFGGETCPEGDTERWRFCNNMTGETSEPASLHMNYLNHDYYQGAIEMWRDGDAQGNVCYDEIRCRLGYRFEVRSVEYPETVSAGETFSVAVDVVNTGWARLHKPRIAKLVLRRNVAPPDPDKVVHDLDGGEVETWEPGEPGGEPPKQPLSITTQAPSTPGTYSVRLWIPDPDLEDNDPDEVLEEQGGQGVLPKATINYAVKLATLRVSDGKNVFDQTTGENDLGVSITVQ